MADWGLDFFNTKRAQSLQSLGAKYGLLSPASTDTRSTTATVAPSAIPTQSSTSSVASAGTVAASAALATGTVTSGSSNGNLHGAAAVAAAAAGTLGGNGGGIDYIDAAVHAKARKMSTHLSEAVTTALNDSSLVMYRVNEHIHKKIPVLVQEKNALVAIKVNVTRANEDLEDARQTISSLCQISEFNTIADLVQRAIRAQQQVRSK